MLLFKINSHLKKSFDDFLNGYTLAVKSSAFADWLKLRRKRWYFRVRIERFSLLHRLYCAHSSRVKNNKVCVRDSHGLDVSWLLFKQQFLSILAPGFHGFKPGFNPKRAGGGGAESPFNFFCYISAGCFFFRAETSWLFSFKPSAQFKTIFIKIGPRVMTWRCVIARWVQRKTDFPLKLHTNCVFCLSGYTSTMFYLIYLVYLE